MSLRPRNPLPRDAAGVEDGGRFNYHLDRLQDTFVIGDGDRYYLTYAGYRITALVLDGTLGKRVARERTPIEDSSSTDCNVPELLYNHGFVGLWEAEADVTQEPLFDTVLPPRAALDRSPRRVLEVALLDVRQYMELALEEICPVCWADLDVTVGGANESVRFACERCRTTFELPVWRCVINLPRIATYLEDHGFDDHSRFELADRGHVTEHGEDPVIVTFDINGDRRVVRYTSDGAIIVDSL